MPSRCATAAALSPNGRRTSLNGKAAERQEQTCDTAEFAERPIDAAEPYAAAPMRSLEWDTFIHCAGASL
jgi:hypothetical protein